ncbi:MAG: HAMP domain-containing protein [Brevibacillus sp.]|nr:HAMP domain-containing protein [Brevibacillus sp.]
MDVLFRSVVGKLWMTIIALFALVLTIFSLLIVQFFDSYYLKKQTDDLRALAERLSESVVGAADKERIVQLAAELGSVYRTGLLAVDEEYRLLASTPDRSILPAVSVEQLLHHRQLPLKEALAGGHPEPTRIIFHDGVSPGNDRTQLLAVTAPLDLGTGRNGAIVMYQALEDFNETMEEIRKLIFVVGVLGFISTTVFAFFLSSRITYPLRQMKQTAHRIAEGDFHAEIPIRTNDEIGELASSFHTMASRLDELVHALSREKEQLASVLRSMVDGVIMIDAEGRIAVTNPPAEQFLRDWEYEQKSEPSPIFSLYQRVLESEQEITEDIPLQGRIWSVVVAPLYVKDQIRGAVAVLRDMTKERKLDKLRKDFVANVSHELRTPLSMLQGYSEAIVDDIAATPEEHKELAKIIYDESVRMSKLVNELLDLARMEAGHVELKREWVALHPYLSRIQRKFANIAREREIALQLEMKTNVEKVWIDPDRMEQVLTNLLDNALRHTPAGGMVKLSVRGGKPLVMEVSDTGSGIPQDDLPFVFERFYKADKARTRGRAGTGLGLGIAKNLVEAHGGTITVHSKVGEGTTFTITLDSGGRQS